MAFIYSRPRIKLPKIFVLKHNRSSNNKKPLKLFIILFVLFTIIYVIIKAITPVFNRLCSDRAKSVTTNTIKNYNYSDFIIIHKDDSGNILMLESNMKNINNVISDVAYRIQTNINQTKEEDVTISLGSFTGISLLSGIG